MKKVLIIGLVWPEPSSSAAGKRIIQLSNLFVSTGYEVVFSSAASKSDFSLDLSSLNISERQIKLNDQSFNLFLKEINPDIVLFDRYITEEQYGFRVEQECPNALRVLDTEDLHCLRYARQQAIKTGNPINLFNNIAKREIASILRCDLSLIISEIEMNILKDQFHIESSLLFYIPFLEDTISNKQTQQWKTFEEREGFMFIGNFLHEPNWNTLEVLKTKIWPILRKKMPNVHLHIYGAYSSQKVLQLHNERENFYILGRALSAEDVISRHRILIAPIQFGAGLKGKFIEAMQVGTPSITTSIGAEAMNADLDWNGVIEDNQDLFIDHSVNLYQDKKLWLQSQQNGTRIINERYEKSHFIQLLIEKIEFLKVNLTPHRQQNFIGQILQYHTANSTKYMSLWIEEKNKTTL